MPRVLIRLRGRVRECGRCGKILRRGRTSHGRAYYYCASCAPEGILMDEKTRQEQLAEEARAQGLDPDLMLDEREDAGEPEAEGEALDEREQ